MRLGSKNNGQDIFNHPVFRSVCFDDLKNWQIEAPWIPTLNNPLDTKYFDTQKNSTHNSTNQSFD